MGQAKKQMMENEDNMNLIGFLEELLKRDELEGALGGIAKQVIAKGPDSMTPPQRAVIDKFVERYKYNNTCEICANGNISDLTDHISIANGSSGLCPMCEYDKEKFMRD